MEETAEKVNAAEENRGSDENMRKLEIDRNIEEEARPLRGWARLSGGLVKRERAEEKTNIVDEVKILWERGQADRTLTKNWED